MMVIWPQVFVEPEKATYPTISKQQCDKSHKQAVADGLCGWALCMSGNQPPKNFGKGMAKIAETLRIIDPDYKSASPDELEKMADKILESKQ